MSSSNTSRIPQARSRGCHRQIIPATRASGCSRPHPAWAGSDKWTAPVWPALFCRQLCFPGRLLGQFLLFTFHFGGVVTLMMVFRLRTGVVPSVFRFSVSTGRFCSVICEYLSLYSAAGVTSALLCHISSRYVKPAPAVR